MTDPASDEPASSEPGGSEPGGPDGPGLTDGPGRAILRLPAALAGEAREVLSGRKEPVRPRDAASVLLLRPAAADVPGPPGIEVYMLRRARSMAFAPGMSAFPGGSVDPRDAEEGMAWAGPDAQEWGRALDAPAALARALVCAAVRETFAVPGRLPRPPQPGAALGSAAPLGALDHPGGRAPPVRHPVLRRSYPGRPADQGRGR